MKEIKRYIDVMLHYQGKSYSGVELFKDGDLVKYADHKAIVDTLQKELDIYKPSSSIQEFVELECLADQTPKQINGIFHKLHNETLMIQKRVEELEAEKEALRGCLTKIYNFDMDNIDDVCEIANVHKFTQMRKDLENILQPKEVKL